MQIIPGILEKEWGEIERKIQIATQFSSTIHIDLIDQTFAKEPTFNDPAPFRRYTSEFFFELHMMVSEPISSLDSWAEAGFKRFIGHVEHMGDQEEFVAKGQLLGEVGLAIDLPTSVEAIKVPYSDLDFLFVMTVKTGLSAQKLEASALEKVRKVKELDHFLKIEVDGGINDSTITLAKEAGVERFVTTSFLFNSEDPMLAFEKLKGLV